MRRSFFVVLSVLAVLILAAVVTTPQPASVGAMTYDFNNLRNIHALCMMYAMEHEGDFPSDWNALEAPPGIFLSGRKIKNGGKPGTHEDVHTWTDYVYVRGLSTSSVPENVLAYVSYSDYEYNQGPAVVYVSGLVEYLTANEWTDLQRAQQLTGSDSWHGSRN